MLERELPGIPEKIPQIVSGPSYSGITSIGYHTVTIVIGAACRQSDTYAVQTRLNHILYDLFRENGFKL